MRRTIIALILAVLLSAGFVLYRLFRTLPVLTVMTWPGDYGRAQEVALMQPYRGHADVNVHLAEYDGGLVRLRRAVSSHSYDGDVIDFEQPDAVEACRDGLLEKIDATALPPGADGKPAASDFVASAVGACWVGSVVYSQAIIAARGTAGSSLDDFFNLKKFPGGRGLRSGPKFNLEMALLADGVPPSAIYTTLSTDEGVARALAKLDTIRPGIVWWSPASDPAHSEAMKLVAGGQVAFSTILNGEIYYAPGHGNTVKVIWDRQLYELDVFGVPAGDPKKEMAMDFIRYATGSAPLAAVADWVPYGPARRSALALVEKNPELGTEMKPFLPTAHFETAFAIDDNWWLAHQAEMEARWQAWLEK